MNRTEYLLIVLMEECAEVSHRASKVLRFTAEEIQPNSDILLTNAQRLMQEIVDLYAVVEMLVMNGVIEPPLDREEIDKKKAKVRRFMEYSRERGTLEPPDSKARNDSSVATNTRGRL